MGEKYVYMISLENTFFNSGFILNKVVWWYIVIKVLLWIFFHGSMKVYLAENSKILVAWEIFILYFSFVNVIKFF